MFDIGGGELLMIIVAILVFFGPKKIPEMMRTLGKGFAQVKKAQAQFTSQINNIQYDMERQAKADELKAEVEAQKAKFNLKTEPPPEAHNKDEEKKFE